MAAGRAVSRTDGFAVRREAGAVLEGAGSAFMESVAGSGELEDEAGVGGSAIIFGVGVGSVVTELEASDVFGES